MFMAPPPPPEAPTYVVCSTIMLPKSSSEPVFKIPEDQHHASDPTLKRNDPYFCNQSFVFPFDMEKPIETEEHEGIVQKLKSLE